MPKLLNTCLFQVTPCSFCIPLSSTECDLWQDQEAKTRACGSTRISEESLSPATEVLGSFQDVNVKSDSIESTGNSKSVSSGEDILLASHSGGDARITNLEDWSVFFANQSH